MSCRCRRRRPLDHYLVAGDSADLDAMRAFLALLPANAYGQVILALDAAAPAGDAASADAESLSTVPDADLAALLGAPARMSVTRLTSTAPPARTPASALATRGAVLTEAVTAWVAEWIPDEPTIDRVVSMWVGGRNNAAVDALCRELPHPVDRL